MYINSHNSSANKVPGVRNETQRLLKQPKLYRTSDRDSEIHNTETKVKQVPETFMENIAVK